VYPPTARFVATTARLIEWLCDAADRVPLSNAATITILDALVEYAHDAGDWLPLDKVPTTTDLFWSEEAQAKKEGRAWPFVQRAVMLPIAAELRDKRTELIARVDGDQERAATAAVLAATTDVVYDARPLTDDDITRLESLLTLPVPSRSDPLIKQQRNRFEIIPAEPMLSGRPEVLVRAAKVFDQLPQGFADIAMPASVAETSPTRIPIMATRSPSTAGCQDALPSLITNTPTGLAFSPRTLVTGITVAPSAVSYSSPYTLDASASGVSVSSDASLASRRFISSCLLQHRTRRRISWSLWQVT
jgi:hypothetical protein